LRRLAAYGSATYAEAVKALGEEVRDFRIIEDWQYQTSLWH
jgi:hypothetical protein